MNIISSKLTLPIMLFAVAVTCTNIQAQSEHAHSEHAHSEHAHKVDSTNINSSRMDTDHSNTATNRLQRSVSPQQIPSYITDKTQIAISNYPLFLLSEAVTKGAPSGKLLLSKGGVGHHGALTPSDMKTIRDSRYVIWFGDELENNLTHSLANQNNKITLFGLNGFNLLPRRDLKGNVIEGSLDPHIWLDPTNAKAITRALGAIYSHANPRYTALYTKNVNEFAKEMDAAVLSLNKSNSLTHSRPYFAYHDAFQYLEPSLNLNMLGALTLDHHIPPKASQILWIKSKKPQNNVCMIMQNDSNTGVLKKLQPITSTLLQEDMGYSKDFISGWKVIAEKVNKCITTSAS